MTGVDGFGDQAWFEAWFEAFAPTSRRYPLPVRALDFQPELIEGEARVFRWPFRFLRAPVNAHTPKYGWKLTETPDLDELDRSLREALRPSGCHGFEISLLQDSGPTLETLRTLAARGRWTMAAEEIERTALVDVDGEWNQYQKGMPRRLRKTLNAQERQLRELGSVEFRDVSGDADWVRWLHKCFELEAAGWKGQQKTAIIQHPNELKFYRTVAEAAREKGRFRLFVVTLAGRLIAFEFSVVEHDALFWLKTAYDEELARYGPGSLSAVASLKECFAKRSVSLFYLPGPGEWKHRWGTRTERLMRVRCAPSGSAVGWLLRGESLARRLKGRLTELSRRSRKS